MVLVLVQGQGKADLATGYELDIIASAVVGGASLAGGRGSVMGAVLGTLIFGVLRNALPQIPGATFYDRLIVGVVVIIIVVADQLLLRRSPQIVNRAAPLDRLVSCSPPVAVPAAPAVVIGCAAVTPPTHRCRRRRASCASR